MQAVHFGAGNIGRGFIGLILRHADYHITFVDVNEAIVTELQQKKQYTVQYANENKDQFIVDQVTAISGKMETQVAEAIITAELITTAVGVNILKFIAPAIAEGIRSRAKLNLPPLTIVACENAIRASSMLREHVMQLLSAELREEMDRFAIFPDAAVDRIVPLQQHEDPLFVSVEPFYEWTIERTLWPAQLPLIHGVHYVDQLDAYIERKLFTVNTGHCCAAYLGNLKGYTTIQQAMQDEEIVIKVKGALAESGAALMAHYGLDEASHQQYIDRILERFQNIYLTDEIARIGRSPIRKLAPQDRLVRPASLAYQYDIEVNHLTEAIAAALFFNVEDDPDVTELQQFLLDHGIDRTLTTFTGLVEDHPLHVKAREQYQQLRALL